MPELHSRSPIPADGEALVDEYNAELNCLKERGQNTWFTAPWLYAEYAFSTVAPTLSRDSHALAATSQVLLVSLPLRRQRVRSRAESHLDIDYFAHSLLYPNIGNCLTRFSLKS